MRERILLSSLPPLFMDLVRVIVGAHDGLEILTVPAGAAWSAELLAELRVDVLVIGLPPGASVLAIDERLFHASPALRIVGIGRDGRDIEWCDATSYSRSLGEASEATLLSSLRGSGPRTPRTHRRRRPDS